MKTEEWKSFWKVLIARTAQHGLSEDDYVHLRRTAYNFVLGKYNLSQELRDDVIDEAISVFVAKINSGEVDPERNPLSYYCTLVRNVLTQQLRNLKYASRYAPAGDLHYIPRKEPSIMQQLSETELIDLMFDLAEELDELNHPKVSYLDALSLKFVGLDQKEIAERLGTSHQTISMKLKTLKAILNARFPEYFSRDLVVGGSYPEGPLMVYIPHNLGLQLLRYHMGQADPLYKVGSLAAAGTLVPRGLVIAAIDALEEEVQIAAAPDIVGEYQSLILWLESTLEHGVNG